MAPSSHKDTLSKLAEIFDKQGIRAGVMYLNSLSRHRFTSLYRFDHETLRNLYFFDREKTTVESSDAIPVISSYCVYVRDSGKCFSTDNSLTDVRVQTHPKRLVIQAYCGVPLVDRDGNMFGTVCHFDVKPVSTDPAQLELLEKVADLLRHRVTRGA
ncbi:MAG: GAF domain-containing protein [Verrucomicrobiota bacterium]